MDRDLMEHRAGNAVWNIAIVAVALFFGALMLVALFGLS